MGLTQKLGTLPLAILTDASNNVGIGAAPSGSYKLEVTGTGRFSGALRTSSTFTSGDTIQLGLASTDGGFWTWGASNSFLVAATGKALNLNPNGTSGSTGLSIATTGAATFSSTLQSASSTISDVTASTYWYNNFNSSENRNWAITYGQADLGDFNIMVSNAQNGNPISAGSVKLNIRKNGNVLIGTTTDAGYKSYILQTINREGLTVECNNASFDYSALLIKTARTTTGGSYRFTTFNNGTSDKLYVIDSGTVYNTTGTYGTISSDIRLKENIVEANSKLNDLLKLRVVNFNLIDDTDKKKQIGFIAQEFKEVFPSLVYEKDTREYDEDGNLTKGLEDSLGLNVGMEFAILVKAIQEQQTIITSLQDRLDKAGL